MKINWGALGVMIAVFFLAVSILTVGLIADKKIETGATGSYCRDKRSMEYYLWEK